MDRDAFAVRKGLLRQKRHHLSSALRTHLRGGRRVRSSISYLIAADSPLTAVLLASNEKDQHETGLPGWGERGFELPEGDSSSSRSTAGERPATLDISRQIRQRFQLDGQTPSGGSNPLSPATESGLDRRTTPAMTAGITKRLWEIGDIVDALEAWGAVWMRQRIRAAIIAQHHGDES